MSEIDLDHHPLVLHLREDAQLEPSSWLTDFPILAEPEIQAKIRSKNRSFTDQKISYRLFWDQSRRRILAVMHFNYSCEGPRGMVHGGALATGADSIMGFHSVRVGGLGYVTLNLSLTYKKFVPLNSVVLAESVLVKQTNKKAWMHCRVFSVELTDALSPACMELNIAGLKVTQMHTVCEALFYQAPQFRGPSYDTLLDLMGKNSGASKETVLQLIEAQRAHLRKQSEKARSRARL
mmetsp:Transcript_3001/g.7315  ORF Transcript_3001/g.7315 Transcript_3001/m.7315 type:complete len:236 (+) Transcript_3001:170-877(+)|eukprot:CAMPEP_0177651170 /NCGR_PEP_ID=MMETSP0447-20121125/12380_1 /TAXON_ID=0 /ORGANISM="Stygamoeba regulata, Strain BSH-02190019" /LENGTH=235 /DNA_ID=CAMNT_0019154183 /DNA_START=159 /DNA_END=866 /DNA_ORIENTATION=+